MGGVTGLLKVRPLSGVAAVSLLLSERGAVGGHVTTC